MNLKYHIGQVTWIERKFYKQTSCISKIFLAQVNLLVQLVRLVIQGERLTIVTFLYVCFVIFKYYLLSLPLRSKHTKQKAFLK